jgi:hypothetical protein
MEIPLEDLISFMDEPTTVPNDPTPPNTNSDKSDIDDDDDEPVIDDDDDDTNDPPKSDNIDISSLTPDSNIHDIFETVKNDVLLLDEDFKFDGTVESLKDAFVTTYEKLTEKAKESLLESLPEDYKLLVKYGLTTKRSVADFFEDNKEISYD